MTSVYYQAHQHIKQHGRGSLHAAANVRKTLLLLAFCPHLLALLELDCKRLTVPRTVNAKAATHWAASAAQKACHV
jgi:hypothetical protein